MNSVKSYDLKNDDGKMAEAHGKTPESGKTPLKSSKGIPRILVFNPPSFQEKNVVRDLLYGCWCQGKRIAGAEFPPHSLLTIYTVLKKMFKVSLIDSQIYAISNAAFGKILRYFDWIIIPSSFQTFHDDLKWLDLAKKSNRKIKTIVFGAITTFLPEVVDKTEIDFGINGEPEVAIRNIIEYCTKNNFNSFYRLSDGQKMEWVKNLPFGAIFSYTTAAGHKRAVKPFKLLNLDELPIPDRGPIKDLYYFNPLTRSKRWTTMLTSRGCPNKCIFCTAPSFYGKVYRYMSPERMIKEVKYLKSLNYDEIFFRDETFTTNVLRVEKFCDLLIEEGIKIKWICNARVNHITPELLMKMKEAGLHTLKFGVESGSDKILKILRKGITVKQIKRAFYLCNKLGINTHAHMIVGSPGETLADVYKSLELLKEIRPGSVTFNLFTPYPGSPYMEEIHTLLNKNGGDQYDKPAIIKLFAEKSAEFFPELKKRHPSMGSGMDLVTLAYKKFYLRPQYFLHTLRSIRSGADFMRLLRSGINVIDFMFNK